MKNMKKVFAATLSASMVMGMTVPVLAAETTPNADVTAPIYSFEVTDVVVPTTYKVAFNPEELTVKMDASDTTGSNAQILSKSYGMINKGNKDQVMSVELMVTDQNGDKITFVDSEEEVTNAQDGEYKIWLTAVPADDAAEVKVGSTPASADKDTAAASLDDVQMTASTTAAAALKSGANTIGFMLQKAEYQAKTGSELTLGDANNDVSGNFEIKALAGAGKGITAFTFGGKMNKKADWTKLTSGIQITAVYTNEVVTTAPEVIDGTGAMVELVAGPKFTTGSDVGTIAYKKGAGEEALKTVTKVEMTMPTGKTFDGAKASANWDAATNDGSKITLASAFLKYYQDAITDTDTHEATITYTTEKGETKTAKVDVKLR